MDDDKYDLEIVLRRNDTYVCAKVQATFYGNDLGARDVVMRLEGFLAELSGLEPEREIVADLNNGDRWDKLLEDFR